MIKSLVVLSALACVAVGSAQSPGTTPVVSKKAPYRTASLPASTRIDTRTFSPQIREVTGQVAAREVDNQFNHLIFNTTEQNTIQLGGMLPTPSPLSTKAKFPAIGFTGWSPPDPDVAIGPNHIVATVNVAIAFYTKSGTKLFEQDLGSNGFFTGMDVTSFVFDPKCFFDSTSNRFYVVGVEMDDTGTQSKVLLAVSDDADPNGTWFRYRIEAKQTVGSDNYWLDYPGFGSNKDAVLITGNMFAFPGSSGFNGIQYILINKTEVNSGGTAVVNYFGLPGGSVQVMRTPDASQDTLYAVNFTGLSTAMIHAFTNLTTTPQLTTKDVAIPTYSRPSAAVQSTNGHTLDPLDGRMLNCNVRNGRMVAAHTVRVASDGTNGSRWYEFNLNGWPNSAANPALRQAGTVGSGGGFHHWMPAISQNANGDIAMVFSRASSTITADFMAASRRPADPLGFMNSPILLQKSTGTTYGSGNGTNRWGDYFGCHVDPIDNTTFWGIGMICDNAGRWQTVVNSFKVTTPFTGGPATIAKFEGGLATGTLANVTTSDNTYFKVNSAEVARTGQVSSAIATFNVGQSNVASLNFTMETSAATYVTASLFIWDWTTSKWVYVGASPQTSADKVWTLGVSAPFSKYVNSAKQAKILVRSIMPFSTIRPAVPYQFRIDHLKVSGTF